MLYFRFVLFRENERVTYRNKVLTLTAETMLSEVFDLDFNAE